jgi:hypothetical protein
LEKEKEKIKIKRVTCSISLMMNESWRLFKKNNNNKGIMPIFIKIMLKIIFLFYIIDMIVQTND